MGPLVKIFVSSITTGEMPENWRLANVVPLFKRRKEKHKNHIIGGEVLGGVSEGRIYIDWFGMISLFCEWKQCSKV